MYIQCVYKGSDKFPSWLTKIGIGYVKSDEVVTFSLTDVTIIDKMLSVAQKVKGSIRLYRNGIQIVGLK